MIYKYSAPNTVGREIFAVEIFVDVPLQCISKIFCRLNLRRCWHARTQTMLHALIILRILYLWYESNRKYSEIFLYVKIFCPMVVTVPNITYLVANNALLCVLYG